MKSKWSMIMIILTILVCFLDRTNLLQRVGIHLNQSCSCSCSFSAQYPSYALYHLKHCCNEFVDADGLATFVFDHSYIENKPTIKTLESSYQCSNMRDLKNHPDHITSLRLAGQYFREEVISLLDFSKYGFSSLEYLHLAFSVGFFLETMKCSGI